MSFDIKTYQNKSTFFYTPYIECYAFLHLKLAKATIDKIFSTLTTHTITVGNEYIYFEFDNTFYMYFLQASSGFDWKQLLLGAEEWSFLPETILRTLIMFIVILTGLRLLGKRGVKQLSVFELVVIIGLGSAAGDPMFYKDVGILPALIVFLVIISLYSFVTYIIGKNKKFEKLIEGKPVCLIKDGVFAIDNFEKEILGEDEFFSELRMQGISQLGQIEEAIEESSGNISVFYYPDEEVKYGLPIMPGSLESSHQKIQDNDYYSCIFCGYTENLKPTGKYTCPTCKKFKWVKSSSRKRVS